MITAEIANVRISFGILILTLVMVIIMILQITKKKSSP